jgi:plastocyanin
MPDPTDDLAALLRERAGDAPAVPPMPAGLGRRIRRRRAARTTALFAAPVLATASVVALVAAPERTIAPATTPAPPTAPTDLVGRYEFCDLEHPADGLHVAAHATETKFEQGCYVVRAGFSLVSFGNPSRFPHNLAVAPDAKEPWKQRPIVATDVVERGESTALTWHGEPLAPGDYALFCQVHPRMYAQLVVR